MESQAKTVENQGKQRKTEENMNRSLAWKKLEIWRLHAKDKYQYAHSYLKATVDNNENEKYNRYCPKLELLVETS